MHYRSAAALAAVLALAITPSRAAPSLTPAVDGPYQVAGNRLLDSAGRPYLIRGTRLPAIMALPEPQSRFDPFSATVLITIRQRLNMNAVRVAVDPEEFERANAYRKRVAAFIKLANRLELLVILDCGEPDVAEAFQNNPGVIFALGGATDSQVKAIRDRGVLQPIIVSKTGGAIADSNIIYEIPAHYAKVNLDQFTGTVPLLADGLDPDLSHDSAECAAFPSDPADATQLLERHLAWFDQHDISWTISAFVPGKLITAYGYLAGTKLDDGWSCGAPDSVPAGIGLALATHLMSAPDPHGLFVVNATRGGFVLARGGIANAYGPILADRDAHAGPPPLPKILGNISVRITDSRGVARFAPLLFAGAGWAQAAFVVPENTACGPAVVEIVRKDGSSVAVKVLIDDVAPGLFTASEDSRGPVIGQVTQEFPNGTRKTFAASQCVQKNCRTIPIPLGRNSSTTVLLVGMGLRNAGPKPEIHAWIAGVPVPVLSAAPGLDPGTDRLTIRLPTALRGLGERDLYFTVNGVLSNVVRINCGAA